MILVLTLFLGLMVACLSGSEVKPRNVSRPPLRHGVGQQLRSANVSRVEPLTPFSATSTAPAIPRSPASSTPSSPSSAPPSTTPPQSNDYDHRWDAVAQCESHWKPADGPTYYGLLGETEQTWTGYGGLQFADTPYDATMAQQVTIGERVEGSYVPDQGGVCAGW
jgi:resuscitation-promoting factor RpfA